MFRSYDEWLAQVPVSITQDSLWSFETYRKALFLSDLAWFDAEKLLHDFPRQGLGLATAGRCWLSPCQHRRRLRTRLWQGLRPLPRKLPSAQPVKPAAGTTAAGTCSTPSMLDRRLKLADEIISGLVTTAKQQYNR